MPLTTGELDRIRAELGYNVLNVGAEPYIGVQAIFAQVIAPYLREGLETTTSTQVTASVSGAIARLIVADPTGLSLHSRVAIDVDDFLEVATVRELSGPTIAVYLKKEHSGTYTVTTDGGLQIVRECLASLYKTQLLIDDLDGTGSLKKVDEVEFYDVRGKSWLQNLVAQQEHWRDRLRATLGIERKPINASRGGTCSLY